MITKFIKEAPTGAEIKKIFVEMLNHENFHFEWDNANKRFVAITPDDAWDCNPKSEIGEIIIHPYANHWAFHSILQYGGYWSTNDQTGETVWEEITDRNDVVNIIPAVVFVSEYGTVTLDNYDSSCQAVDAIEYFGSVKAVKEWLKSQ